MQGHRVYNYTVFVELEADWGTVTLLVFGLVGRLSTDIVIFFRNRLYSKYTRHKISKKQWVAAM